MLPEPRTYSMGFRVSKSTTKKVSKVIGLSKQAQDTVVRGDWDEYERLRAEVNEAFCKIAGVNEA